jgi:hypothetical protein
MQRFEYRHPRFSVDLPAQFFLVDEMVAGRCVDISTQGMRLELSRPVAPGSCGTVSLRYQNQTIELNARVTHTGSAHSGLEFLCHSAAEQSAVAHLVALLTAPRKRRPMALVPRFVASYGFRSTRH